MTPPLLTLRRETLHSPLGEVLILTDDEGRLRALDFDTHEDRLHRLLDRHYGRGGWMVEDAPAPTDALAAVRAYFAGDLRAIDALPTATGGTAFQREVWAALREVGPDRPVSYGAIAARIGRPKAVRAVGLANGANPVAIVVPCHRVIGGSGALTGYGGGLDRKRWLLEHEARHIASAHPCAGGEPDLFFRGAQNEAGEPGSPPPRG